MNESNYYKLYDEEDTEYYSIIRTNMPCSELIHSLISIYQEHNFIDTESEDFDEQRNELLEWAKDGLHEVYEQLGLEDSDDFDNKAEEIVDDFINRLDLIGNTEEYVVDTMRDLGIKVEYLEIDEEIPY